MSAVTPPSAYQEQTLDVVVTGVYTHFVAGQTLAAFGAGVTVNGVTVQSATQVTVERHGAARRTPGVRAVTMATGLESASGNGLFTVLAKETPAISWATPADIVYGTALGAAQLNATANTAGSFSYTPVSGTMLTAGSAQPLSATFTPDNPIRYFSATATVYINVAKAMPAGAERQRAAERSVSGVLPGHGDRRRRHRARHVRGERPVLERSRRRHDHDDERHRQLLDYRHEGRRRRTSSRSRARPSSSVPPRRRRPR